MLFTGTFYPQADSGDEVVEERMTTRHRDRKYTRSAWLRCSVA